MLSTSCVAGFFSRYVFESDMVERYLFSLYALVISEIFTELTGEGILFPEEVLGGGVTTDVVDHVEFMIMATGGLAIPV
jgi:hypothetical protein